MRQLVNNILVTAANKTFPALILTCSMAASLAQAAPQGGVIVGGQGSISSSSNTTNINQQTGSMVVDWASFNVNPQETVNFNQPSATAAALNRIYDQNPSQIFGAINANGRVFLSNPNGIVFGQTATVNVGALMATSLNISKEDFMSGNYHFNSDGYTPGAVINHGILNAASGGSISLVGGQVVNEGYIIADYGHINLATGKQAILNFDGDGLISFQVSEDILTNLNDAESSLSNSGSLQANGGRILLDAHVAKDVFTYAVNNEGMITAHRMENKGGEVYLSGNSGTTMHRGSIDTYGENGEGGSVLLLGDRVGVIEQASIDSSGDEGGGTVLIGGDYQGKNAEIQNAEFTYIGENTSIHADAVQQGNGGRVVVWADNTTRYYGDISAQGGSLSGGGGFVEVSGKENLDFSGVVNVSSIYGKGGTVLLDPDNINLTNATSTPPGTVTDSPTNTPDIAFSADPGSDYTINVADVVGFEELYLQATNDITLTNALTMTATVGSVKFEAGNDININNDLIVNGTGSVTLIADSNTPNGAGDVNVNAAITTNGGAFNSSGVDFTGNGSGIITTNGGAVDINHTGAVTVGANIDSSGVNHNSNPTAGGNVSITALAGAISTADITTTGGRVTGNNNTIAAKDGGAVTIVGTGGTIAVGDISTLGGNADSNGDGNGGSAGLISLTQNTNALMTVGDIDAQGGTAGDGSCGGCAGGGIDGSDAAVTMATSGNVQFAGTNSTYFASSITVTGSGSGSGLTGPDRASTWAVTSAGTGTLTDNSGTPNTIISFSNVANLTGGSNVDIFNIGADLTGTVSGGASGDDFNFNAGTVVGASGDAGNDTFDFNGGSVTGTLAGGTETDTITGNAQYTVSTADAGSASSITAFNTVENLTGTANDDTFNINANLTGTASGLGGDDTFNLTVSATTNGALTGIDGGVDGVNGDVLVAVGGTGANDWAVTSADGGTLTNNLIVNAFSDIENLTGNANVDNFTFTAALTGTASGLAEADVFNVNAGGSAGAIAGGADSDTLQGAALANATNLTGSTADGFNGTNASVTSGFTGINILNASGTLTGQDAISNWTTSAVNAGSYETGGNTLTFSGFSAWTGGDQADTFDLGHNVVTVNGGDGTNTYNVNALITANLAGGTGNDTFNIDNVLTGSVTGGSGGVDTLQGAALASLTTLNNSTADGFDGSNVGVTSGFTGITTLNASGTLVGQDEISNWSTTSANAGSYETGGNTLTFSGFSTWTGGSLADTFYLGHDVSTLNGGNGTNIYNVNASITSALNGGTGTDNFVFNDAAVLTGSIIGAGGTDTLDLSAYMTALTFDLLAGTVSGAPDPISGTFGGIDVITGGSAGNIFNVNTNIAVDLNGGAGTDNFVFDNAAVLTGNIAGGGGTDTLDLSNYISALAFAVTTVDTDGATGTVNPVSGGGFSGINVFASGSGTDSITLANATGFTDVNHVFNNATEGSIDIDATNLTYTNMENITDNLLAENRSFTYPGGNEDIVLRDDGSNNNKSEVYYFGKDLIFINPTESVSISAGLGNDTIYMGALEASFDADIIINGDDGVDIAYIYQHVIAGTTRSINVTAETIDGYAFTGHESRLTANSVDLNAVTGIGESITLGIDAANISADTINGNVNINSLASAAVVASSLSTGSGNIQFNQTGNQLLTLTNVSTTDGNVTVTNTGGTDADILVGSIITDAINDIVTIASEGAIDDLNADTIVDVATFEVALSAVEGVGNSEQIEVDATQLSVNNTLAGDINILDVNDVLLLAADNVDGEINIIASNDLILAAGLNVTTTGANGDINFGAGNAIIGNGALTIDSAKGFSFSQAITTAGTTSITTNAELSIAKNITTTSGDINIDSKTNLITFSSDVVLTAENSINISTAASVANGDLALVGNGIDLDNELTVNGDLTLNAGTGELSISNKITAGDNDVIITAADLDINTSTGGIEGTASSTVTLNDNSVAGMELGGNTLDPDKFKVGFSEYELINAGSVVLSTPQTLTLKDKTFQTIASIASLTINASEFIVEQAGALLGLQNNLDLTDTAVKASADFTIDVTGSFGMNNSIETQGAFSLTSGQTVTMGEPSSITTNNHSIDIITNGGDILLGLANAGTANDLANSNAGRVVANSGTGTVNITASAGSVLNNNGVFSDVTKSKTNVIASSTTITANERIGASSTDAITIDASAQGLITLDFNAEKAFINNLQNTRIQNNGTGDVAVGLIFSGQIIGVGHKVGLDSADTEEVPEDKQNEDSMLSVLGADHKLSAIDEEEEDSSTLNTVVPVMIRTKDGWEFKAPLRAPVNKGGQERKVDWL